MKDAGWRSQNRWRNTRLRCDCLGYHFPHRKSGGACEHSPRRSYYWALRNGATRQDAMLELSAAQIEVMFPLTLAEPDEDTTVF